MPVPATIGKLPSHYRGRLGVRSIPRIRKPRTINVVTLRKGKRRTISWHNILNITAMLKSYKNGPGEAVLADGLVRATDNAPDGSEEFLAQIRPANPGDGAWSVGYVQSRYLVMVSLFDTHAHIYGIIFKSVIASTR